VLQPVQGLADQLEKFAEGELVVAPPSAANAMQEVNRLITAFAHMSASLRDKQAALQDAAQHAGAAARAMANVAHEYEALYNDAPCGYHSIDGGGVIRRMNDTELRWLGYTRDEVVDKKTALDLLAPESRATYLANFPSFLRNGFITDIEVSYVRKDGSAVPVLVNATGQFNERGELVVSRSVVLEHGRLRQERETLRSVLTAAPMAVRVATINDNRVLFMNRAFCDLVQRTEAQAREMDISKNYVDPAAFEGIRSELTSGRMVLNRLVELRLPDSPDSPHVWALGSYMSIDYEGERAVLAWLYDVTQLRAAPRATSSPT
jgi:PAS domain S-box-containing protein